MSESLAERAAQADTRDPQLVSDVLAPFLVVAASTSAPARQSVRLSAASPGARDVGLPGLLPEPAE